MSFIETAIGYSKRIETVLVNRYGATGKGLHEKVSSVASQLPVHIVRKSRHIASVRNKLVHEDGYVLDDSNGFTKSCEEVLAALDRTPTTAPVRPASIEPAEQLSDIARWAGKWASICFVALPVAYIWWRLVAITWGGPEVTFANSRGPTGNWVMSAELVPIVITAACLGLLQLSRLLTVLFTVDREVGAKEPLLTSYILKQVSTSGLILYGFTYLLWAFNFRPSGREVHWPLLTLLAMAVVSFMMVWSRYLYGLKLDESSEPLKIQRADHALTAGTARVQMSSLRFANILGNTDIKHRLKEAARVIVSPQGSGVSRNGILLHGEPGNGKTIFAEALAGELNLPFLQLTNTDVESKWVGEKTTNIKAAFEQARQSQPCVLFIDEIDSFIPDRESLSSRIKEDTDIVNSMLTLLVDIRRSRVIVVAATNYLDRLDGAAIREGRFDFKVEITAPDEEARVGLLRSGMNTHAPSVHVSDEVLKNVAQRWNGFTVKRILAVSEEMPSYLLDLKKKGTLPGTLGFEDFMAALRRIQSRKGAMPENIKGMDELVLPTQTKEALEMIIGRLRDPVRIERLGGTLPTGLLFHGPAGTGKTTAAKALAKEVGSAFLIATGTDMSRDPKALDKLYTQAKELRPAIIFIDEADDLLRSREFSTNTGATNKLLTLMDGVNDRVRDIVWIAATNYPDQIDAALLRGGRFTEKVEFVLPTSNQLRAQIDEWLQKRKVNLAPGLTAATIARWLGEESVANAEAVMQHAVNRAISQTTGDLIEIDSDDIRVGFVTVLRFDPEPGG